MSTVSAFSRYTNKILGFSSRINDHLARPSLAASANREPIYFDQCFSAHPPLKVEYDLTL